MRPKILAMRIGIHLVGNIAKWLFNKVDKWSVKVGDKKRSWPGPDEG